MTSDDQDKTFPAIMDFRHAPVGTNTRNTIWSDSELLLPVLKPIRSRPDPAGTEPIRGTAESEPPA